MARLLHIGDRASDADMLEGLAASGIDLENSGPEAWKELDQAQLDAIDALLIAPTVDSPVRLAREFHEIRPDAHIVFISSPRNEATLRRELTFAPRIGNHWSVVSASAHAAAVESILAAVQDTGRRKQLRTTLRRMNRSLAGSQTDVKKLPVVNDEFIAAVFDQLSDAVILVDLAGVIIAANATATRMFMRDLVRGSLLRDVVELPQPLIGLHEIRFERADGVAAVLELSAEPVRSFSGAISGTAVVARDVTDRALREERRRLLSDATVKLSQSLDLHESLQRFAEAIVGSLADLCVVDLLEGDHMIRVAVAASHKDDAEAVEKLRKFSPSPSRRGHPSVSSVRDRDVVVRNFIPHDEWPSMTANREHLAIVEQLQLHSLASAPIPVGDQQLAGSIVFVRGRRRDEFGEEDVHLIRELATRAGTALTNAWLYQAADQANRAKDAFLATLSHELRTPMTSILGWIQILRMGATDEVSLDEGLNVIEKSARVQAQLIEDLLDLSRIDSGKLHLEMHEVDLGEVAAAAVDTITPAAGAKRIALDVSIEPDVRIAGDPNRLQQVVWNLLSNAVKFTPAGGRVSLTMDTEGSRARVIVRDSGKGIEPEFLPFVFDRFQQADSATTRRFGGLGLGLSIVRQLVELHGGTVEASSRGEGMGATFTVHLPIPAVRQESGEAQPQPTSVVEGTPLAGVSVLVVEDDDASAAMIRALLTRAGARVEVCDSVSGALDLLRLHRPDVLVSDIAMPGEDGFDLIRQVRNRLRIPPSRLPALALTAFGDMETRVAVLGAGFQLHLQKPAEVSDIVAAVLDLAGRSSDRNRQSEL